MFCYTNFASFFSLARKYWATVNLVTNRRERRVIPQSAFYFLLLDFDEDNLILISTCSKLQLLLHVKAISMLKKLLHKSNEVFWKIYGYWKDLNTSGNLTCLVLNGKNDLAQNSCSFCFVCLFLAIAWLFWANNREIGLIL